MAETESTRNQLCDFCSRLLREHWVPRGRHVSHPAWRGIERSARTCKLCAIIWRVITTSDGLRNSMGVQWMERNRRMRPPFSEWASLDIKGDSDEDTGTLLRLHVVAMWPGSDLEPDFVGSLEFYKVEDVPCMHLGALPSSSDSEEVWSLVQDWMHTCRTKHKECNIVPPVTWRPTRLLDVHSSSDRLKLCEGDDIPHRPSYATLSHCWGEGGHRTLNKQTAARIQSGLRDDELDPTFRDAVQITRKLKSQYLWIDSLCIYQDSLEDWKRESSHMGEIYQFASFNIAASGAQNAKDGCFAPRRVDNDPPALIQSDDIEYVCARQNAFWGRFNWTPLSLRAWILQERFLAPRVIHWGFSEMVWECNHHYACERFPLGLKYSGNEWPSSDYKKVSSIVSSKDDANGLTPDRLEQVEEAWRVFVGKYSVAKLTFESDKLVALKGIVNTFRSLFRTQFFAGLWEDHMELELLWQTYFDWKSERRISHIPTWSWLSLRETPIFPATTGIFPVNKDAVLKLCRVMEKGGTGDSGNQFSISDAFLKIRCSLAPAAFRHIPSDHWVGLTYILCWTALEQPQRFPCAVQFDTVEKAQFSGIWCMPVSQDTHRLKGLLLANGEDERPDVYHRVGVFWTYSIQGIEILWKSCDFYFASQQSLLRHDKILRYHPSYNKSSNNTDPSTAGTKNHIDSNADGTEEKDLRTSYWECDGIPQHVITLK